MLADTAGLAGIALVFAIILMQPGLPVLASQPAGLGNAGFGTAQVLVWLMWSIQGCQMRRGLWLSLVMVTSNFVSVADAAVFLELSLGCELDVILRARGFLALLRARGVHGRFRQ